jgi:hypothetical protein
MIHDAIELLLRRMMPWGTVGKRRSKAKLADAGEEVERRRENREKR